MNQRFFSIYDGPSLQDSNSYLDITPTQLTDCVRVDRLKTIVREECVDAESKFRACPGFLPAKGRIRR